MTHDQYNKIKDEVRSYQMKRGGGVHSIIEKDMHMRKVCKKHNCSVADYQNASRTYARGGMMPVAEGEYVKQLTQILEGTHTHDWLVNRPKGQMMKKGGNTVLNVKKKLSKSFALPYEVSVYVPSTIGVDQIIDDDEFEERIEDTELYLSNLFGGYSKVDIDGGYVSKSNNLVKEAVGKVTSFGSRDGFEPKMEQLIGKLSDWCAKWGQESIGLEFEGDLFYIESGASFRRGGIASKKAYIAWKMGEVMGEYKRGKLRSSSGQKVTDRKQAIAIGLSVAQRGWERKKK